MTQINIEDTNELKKAYLLLKRETYYEHVDLFLRAALADFEKGGVEKELEVIQSFLRKRDLEAPWLKKQLNSIGVNFLPKKIKLPENHNQKSFITNLRTQDNYEVEEINYFFSGPIAIYILSILWCIEVGPYLDKELSDDCIGNRLDLDEDNISIKSDFRLFKLYINQYNQWRDKAIQSGLDLLEKNKDVLLIALDFKQCYYRLPVKWEPIIQFIQEKAPINEVKYLIFLTNIIKSIHLEYHNKTEELLTSTHKTEDDSIIPVGIPVGLPSSRILANWELKEFDSAIQNNLRPFYFGRYVDDILIVINNPNKDLMKGNTKVTKIICEYFGKTKILDLPTGFELNCDDDKATDNNIHYYKVHDYQHLYIQNSKIIIHYYDHQQSWAGLKEFKEELKQRASEFRFLPSEDQYKDLVDEAYDIQYDGSIYRFRSVIGINENATKLSHYLYKQQLKNWLSNDGLRNRTVDEIFRFYQGVNIFDYCRLWEKIFTLFIVSKRYQEFYKFHRDLERTIQKLTFSKDGGKIAEKLKIDCISYKKISMSLAIGYMGKSISKEKTSHQFYNLVKKEFGINNSETEQFQIPENQWPILFRDSMLLRHQNMFWPLLDYTNFPGNLTKFDWSAFPPDLEINTDKLANRSRYIQLDELYLLKYLRNILTLDPQFEFDSKIFFHFNEYLDANSDSNDITYFDTKILSANNIHIDWKNTEKLKIHTKIISNEQQKRFLSVGIVNLKVNEQDIEASYNPIKKTTNRYKRQVDLFDLINLGIREPKCDLMVFPELSIPFAWLPFMVNQARRNNIGFIFGVEHIVRNPYVLNLVATILPYKDANNFTNVYLSLRLKNYYSPKEEHELSLFNLKRPNYDHLYEKFSWHGVVFSTYNCYELTDINHRGLFRSEIDLLCAVEYNQDINYFSNIIEAASRDIHCYAIQANTSNYGDSRVISPMVTEKMNIIRVKGGDNSVLLKTTLDIEAIRDFQSREYSPSHCEYKPTPAGYDHNKARNRQ